jgi:hypothetical protein
MRLRVTRCRCREARGERREARGERREARGERREARGERREAPSGRVRLRGVNKEGRHCRAALALRAAFGRLSSLRFGSCRPASSVAGMSHAARCALPSLSFLPPGYRSGRLCRKLHSPSPLATENFDSIFSATLFGKRSCMPPGPGPAARRKALHEFTVRAGLVLRSFPTHFDQARS